MATDTTSLSMTPTEFAENLRSLLQVHGSPGADGEPELEIVRIEQRSNKRIPEILRVCYQIGGRHRALLTGYECLVPCDKLNWMAEHCPRRDLEYIGGMPVLIDMRGEEYFVIQDGHLEESDPPIHKCWPNSYVQTQWGKHLSSYLIVTACKNSIGMLHSDKTIVSEADYSTLSASLKQLNKTDTNDFVLQQGAVIVAADYFYEGEKVFKYKLSAAAKSKDELVKFAKQHGLSFEFKGPDEFSQPKYYPG